jgi:hypothetical protein
LLEILFSPYQILIQTGDPFTLGESGVESSNNTQIVFVNASTKLSSIIKIAEEISGRFRKNSGYRQCCVLATQAS